MRFQAALPAAILIALTASACGGSSPPSDDPRAQSDLTEPRTLAELWAELLTQRDLVHGFVTVEEIWHEESAGVATAVTAMEAALPELAASLDREAKLDAARRTGIDLEIGRLYQTLAAFRNLTATGAVGGLPRIMPLLDLTLLGLEQQFSPEELGSNSVATHPGFNPVLPPPPDSPV